MSGTECLTYALSAGLQTMELVGERQLVGSIS